MTDAGDPLKALKTAFESDNADLLRSLLDRSPDLKAKIDDPVFGFDSPAITCVKSRQMLDVLLDAGADINARSRWWAGGFGLLDNANPKLAEYAIARGAIVDAHSAARLGMLDRLRALIAADPTLVNARGGDGQTPLHFASTVDVARFLLDDGADVNALDVDHESTPAQWMIRDRQEVVRYLVSRGCKTDILLLTALGDMDGVRECLDKDPEAIRVRVTAEYFPMNLPHAGGTIYQWTLGFYVSAHQVAAQFNHDDVLRLLMERSPSEVKLIESCWQGDRATVDDLKSEQPDLASRLTEAERRQIADAARNNNLKAVELMLAAGLPLDARGQHRATPLHWAAWHGNHEMVRQILQHNPPLEDRQNDFNATPLGWAIHGFEHGWHREEGKYGETVQLLLTAGAKMPEGIGGTEEVRAVLRKQKG